MFYKMNDLKSICLSPAQRKSFYRLKVSRYRAY